MQFISCSSGRQLLTEKEDGAAGEADRCEERNAGVHRFGNQAKLADVTWDSIELKTPLVNFIAVSIRNGVNWHLHKKLWEDPETDYMSSFQGLR